MFVWSLTFHNESQKRSGGLVTQLVTFAHISQNYPDPLSCVLLPSQQGVPEAYIPLRCKTICIGSLRWPRPPTPQFCVWDANMLVSKNAKICVTPNANAKICVTPNANAKICVTANANPQHEQVAHYKP